LGFLESIQAEITDQNTSISGILLKLRLFASKLGSDELAEWINYESEGYPSDVNIPDYRVLGISISGTFYGPFGSGVKNAPIPPALIHEFAGEKWTTQKLRESAASVEKMASNDGGIHLNLSNLMLLLNGKVYPDYVPVEIKGYIPQTALIETANAIRNRLLSLTIEVAKKIPEAKGVGLAAISKNPEAATQIFHQTINGNMTNVHSSGDNVVIQLSIKSENIESLKDGLSLSGLNDEDVETLAYLIADEKPTDKNQITIGQKTRKWLGDRITQGVDGGVKGGITALTNLVQEAAMQYWGLK
jgi:AbiTii-like protein